jgi:hypothetical protein
MSDGDRRLAACTVAGIPRNDIDPVRTLTLRDLNRATLARQLLLRRQRVSLVPAAERIAGLQGQWPPAPYVGLWARVEGFRRGTLDRALAQQRIVKATLMRATLHLVSARDYPIFTSALHGDDAPLLSAEAIAYGEKVAPGVRDLFSDGARSRADVFAWLEEEHGLGPAEVAPWGVWFAIRVRGHVVHAPESASWTARTNMRFVALPDIVLPDTGAARIELVRRYLGAFGPATRADIADWSGLRVGDFAPALEALEPLRRFRNEEGKELLDLSRAPLPDADTPAPVRLLPKWDSLLLGHKDRRRVMSDAHRKIVIAKNGDVAQTFLVDGRVAGTWALTEGRVRFDAFGPVPRTAGRELAEEACRLEAFVL